MIKRDLTATELYGNKIGKNQPAVLLKRALRKSKSEVVESTCDVSINGIDSSLVAKCRLEKINESLLSNPCSARELEHFFGGKFIIHSVHFLREQNS